jgi:hypothetical protein
MYGFGHDPILDNYKVVVILHASSSSSSLVAKTYAMVYTLRRRQVLLGKLLSPLLMELSRNNDLENL